MINFWITKDGTGVKLRVYSGSGSSRREIACYYLTNAEFDNLRTQLELLKADKVFTDSSKKPIFKVGDKVRNYYDRSLPQVVIEAIDDTCYYGDTTNFDIAEQNQWGIVRSCDNCKCGYYHGKTKDCNFTSVSCYLHKDCGGDEPIIIYDYDFVETAMNCEEFEEDE